MKKAKLLFIFFTCGLLAACGKKEKADIGSPDLNYDGVAKEQPTAAQGNYGQTNPTEMAMVPGVQIVKDQTSYSYSYTEQADGSLLFTIEGTWDENQTWDIIHLEEPIVIAKEISQSKEKVEYQFTAKKDLAGYSEFYINLSETETDKDVYTIAFSTISDSENKVKALNAYGYIPSDEADTETEDKAAEESSAAEETTAEVQSPEEVEYMQEMENGYASIVGERSFPEAFTINEKGYIDILEIRAALIAFTYKDHLMSCSIAPSLTIEELKQAVEESDTWITKTVGETEVVYYVDGTDTTMIWMDETKCCYMLSGRGIEESVFDDVISLMVEN